MTVTLPQHLAVVALLAVDAVARGVRFRALVPMPLSRAIGVNCCGDAAGALTPAGLGADPVRFAAFQRSGAAGSAIVAAFATELGVNVAATVAAAVLLSGLFTGVAGELERVLAALLAPSSVERTLALVVLPAAVGAAVLVRLRRRLPPRLVSSIREAWPMLLRRRPPLLAAVGALTLLSLAARTAILPVLAAGARGADARLLIVGSFLLILGQSVLPTPAGAGGVDLGFLAGFAHRLGSGAAVQLLVVWRIYTIALGVVVGGLVLARAGAMRRRAVRVEAERPDSTNQDGPPGAGPEALGRDLREPGQQAGPAALGGHALGDFRGGGAVPLDVAVHQLDARAAAGRVEAHLHLAGVRGVGVVLPLAVEVPGEDEAARRLPGQHAAPDGLGPVLGEAVAPAAGPGLDHLAGERRVVDVVAARPPAVDPAGEHLEGLRGRRGHGDAAPHGEIGGLRRHRSSA